MVKNLFNKETKSVSFASAILAGSYLVSAFLGFIRDHLLTNKLPVSQLDIYYSAFVVPDFIALICILGAISAAIVPIFSSVYANSKQEAWRYVSNLMNIFLLCMVIICTVFIIFAPFIIKFTAPGFSPEKQQTAAMLMRIMFLSPIILGISNIISGILQIFHKFLVTALAPIMYNIGIIIGILFFLPVFGLPGLAFGVIFGGLLHLGIQLTAFFHSGFKYKKIFDFKDVQVMKTLQLMVPRSLGLGAGQLNNIAITAIASTLAGGSVAVFNLANNLASFMVSAVAVSISTAVFPAMARANAAQNNGDFQKKFSGAFLQSIFLTIPASILIFLLRAQIVRFLYGSGNFGWLDTRLTAACLGIFTVSLFAQGLVFVLSKTFYALHNTKIPAIVSALTVAFNIVMSLGFLWILRSFEPVYNVVVDLLRLQGIANVGVVALAFAFSVTALVESFCLLWLLYKNYKTFRLRHAFESISKIAIAGFFMATVTLFVRDFLVVFNIIQLQTVVGIFTQLAISSAVGGLVYVLVSHALKSKELDTLKGLFKKNATRSH